MFTMQFGTMHSRAAAAGPGSSAGASIPHTSARPALLAKYLSTGVPCGWSTVRPTPMDWLPHSYSHNAAASTESNGAISSSLLRRQLLLALSASTALPAAAAVVPPAQAAVQCPLPIAQQPNLPDYTGPGPFAVQYLPRLEHTCTDCFPKCTGDTCLLRIDVTFPRGAAAVGLGPPYPLAIFTSGFLVNSAAYKSYADTLASWGYTVVRYDKFDTLTDTLDDVTSVAMLRELVDWCGKDALMRQLADTSQVFLAGHSRGGKISMLAAAQDLRVAAVCLLDPVDNTVYAPLAPGYPSAVAALRTVHRDRPLPVAVVGAGIAGDCAPVEANFRHFYSACPTTAWEVLIQEAGHFQFLDSQSALQRVVCAQGQINETAVRRVSQAVMVAWAEIMMRPPGADVLSLLRLGCDGRQVQQQDGATSSGGDGSGVLQRVMQAPQLLASTPLAPRSSRRRPWSLSVKPAVASEAGPGLQPPSQGRRRSSSSSSLPSLEGLGPLDAPAGWHSPSDMTRFLEHMLTRLQYQQGLSISSRFKNLA